MVNIRLATFKDIPVIQQIAYATWPATYGEIISQTQIAYMLEMMYAQEVLEKKISENEQTFYIARIHDEDVGFIGLESNYEDTLATKIHKIYVLPNQQGTGVGKALVLQAIDFAKSKEDIKLLLNVNRFNPAVQFYEKLGFHILKQEDIDIGSNFLMEDYVMELPLAKHELILRKAEIKDCNAMMDLIKELAIYEKAIEKVTVTIEEFEAAGFGNNPVWKAWVVEDNKQVVGMALCYVRYSTWKGSVLYLEDFIVKELYRGNGIGKMLFDACRDYAKEQGYKGLSLQVLDWNTPAINFYKKYPVTFEDDWINVWVENNPN